MSDNHIVDQALNYLADYINQANQLIISQIVTGTAATIAATARNTFYIDAAKEGYTPLGIGQVNMTGSNTALARIASFGMTSTETVWITVENGSNSSQSWTPNAVVIYKGQKMVQANPVEYVNDYTMMMNRQLEMSVNPWSSGTCSITGISNYDVIKVIQGGEQPLIGLRRQGTSATQAFYYLFSIIPTSASHYTKGGIITTNGDSCTFNKNIVVLNHAPNSNHGALGGAEAIIKVIGLIPRHDTIADIQTPLSNPMTDFIISQGSESNGWGWRKWNSGRLEQWGLIRQTSKTGTSFGNMYYATYTGITYPIPFINLPALNVTPYGGTMGILGNITHTETGITSYDMYRTNAGYVGGTVSCYVTGAWK